MSFLLSTFGVLPVHTPAGARSCPLHSASSSLHLSNRYSRSACHSSSLTPAPALTKLACRPDPLWHGAARPQRCHSLRAAAGSAATDAEAATPLSEATRVTLDDSLRASGPIPPDAGIYAVYNSKDELQYVGLTRKVGLAVSLLVSRVPCLPQTRVGWCRDLCSTVSRSPFALILLDVSAADREHRHPQAEPPRPGASCEVRGDAERWPRGSHRGLEGLDADSRCALSLSLHLYSHNHEQPDVSGSSQTLDTCVAIINAQYAENALSCEEHLVLPRMQLHWNSP